MLTVVLRKDVTVVPADRLDVLAAIFGDACLNWHPDLLDVISN